MFYLKPHTVLIYAAGACVWLVAACNTKERGIRSAQTFPEEVQTLAKQFRELRKERGWFRGGVAWIPEVDTYGGKMHKVMLELEQRLKESSATKSDLVELLGKPDAVRAENGARKLIYFWRGWHDYLYFVCEGERVKETGWYFALE